MLLGVEIYRSDIAIFFLPKQGNWVGGGMENKSSPRQHYTSNFYTEAFMGTATYKIRKVVISGHIFAVRLRMFWAFHLL
jgi:hypothetical protein